MIKLYFSDYNTENKFSAISKEFNELFGNGNWWTTTIKIPAASDREIGKWVGCFMLPDHPEAIALKLRWG